MTTKSTYRLRAADMDRRWHVVDAAERPLGRVAGEVARLLQGKHKATFEPHMAMGDFVVVVNAKQVDLTGKKREQKRYYRHTGYPGGLRERSFEEQLDKDPTRVIDLARARLHRRLGHATLPSPPITIGRGGGLRNRRRASRRGNDHPWMRPHGGVRDAHADAWLAVAVDRDAHFGALARAIGQADPADDGRPCRRRPCYGPTSPTATSRSCARSTMPRSRASSSCR